MKKITFMLVSGLFAVSAFAADVPPSNVPPTVVEKPAPVVKHEGKHVDKEKSVKHREHKGHVAPVSKEVKPVVSPVVEPSAPVTPSK